MQQCYISEISTSYRLDQRIVPLFPYEMKGMERLREVERVLFGDG